ncbi:MAG TPA: class I SAM-dependent methyltransferase, partial [Rhodopila sp.]|nr:class I SAM-dependent methyltransferase [Rhodopila sp.]
MLKYYAWAAAEKTLSFVPGGATAYKAASLLANSNDRSKRRLVGCSTAYRLVRKARELTPAGGTILDVGTGWHHHDPILLYLFDGNYKFYLFDIEDRARLGYLRTYFRHLLENLDELEMEIGIDRQLARQKLEYLLTLGSRQEIYQACNFELCITRDIGTPFLPEGSVDCMVSNCVLTHIPPSVLEPELLALRRMLKPAGAMYMMIGHDDHWAFHDATVNMFNYYRYSDRTYHLLFDTNFEYQNRMVKSEWLPVFRRTGLDVVEYHGSVSDESYRAIDALPRIDERFARYPRDELATIHSYFLLRHADGHWANAGAPGSI